jgi:voltage-gated potassium channel
VVDETVSAESVPEAGLTPKQLRALDVWHRRSNLPILLAAIVPLVVSSPQVRAVAIVVGLGSWLVFLVDLVVQRRIVRDYLHTRNGRIDLAIVVFTFPYYLIPGAGSYTAILAVARLARVARVLMATRGLRRLAKQLGKVVSIAGIMLVICSLAAYEAERKTNPEFGSIGDAFWWGIVTLTTVGYGDIVPKTTDGRVMGVIIMVTGVAVLGLLAGNLASFLRLDPAGRGQAAPAHAPATQYDDLARRLDVIQADLARIARAVDGLPTGRKELPDENRGEGDGPGGPSSTAE